MTGRETGILGDMSKKQLREHKQENQRRKSEILKEKCSTTGKRNSVWFNGGVIQDGKYSIKATHGQG